VCDALQYVQFVKASLAPLDALRAKERPPQEPIFKEFCQMLKSLKQDKDNIPAVIQRMADIFIGRNNCREIMSGLSTFLPEGYAISFPVTAFQPIVTYPPGATGPFAAPPPPPPIVFEEHCRFVGKVKAAFETQQPAKYALFRQLLQRYRDIDNAKIEELHLHTAIIFEGHREVLAAFWEECGCAGGCVKASKGCCQACPPPVAAGA